MTGSPVSPRNAGLELHRDGEVHIFQCAAVATIGRDKSNDICLSDSSVSRNHAIIRRLSHNDYYVMDFGSTNGSYVNEKRLTLPTQLQHGDQLRLGETSLRFINEEVRRESSEIVDVQDKTVVAQHTDLREITILVSDIRSFTPMTEQTPFDLLVALMGKWFHDVTDSIIEHGGHVDKFIGDCVYARWYTGENACGSTCSALRSAVGLNAICGSLNECFPDLPMPLKIGVGINSGEAVVDFGRESTAMGDSVNLAFRLENISKELNKDIVLSRSVYRHLPEEIWKAKEQQIAVKGKRKPVHVCGFSFAEIGGFLETLSSLEH